jgi:hypothetical protein
MYGYILQSTLLACALLFSACLGAKNNSPQKNVIIPTWYINTPVNNELSLYGTGFGYSVKEAKHDALNNMSASLITSISSDTTINTTSNSSSNEYNKNVNKEVKVKTETIDFTNAKVNKTVLINNAFYILVSVDREALFSSKLIKFKLLDNKIKKDFLSSSTFSKLERIYALQVLKEKIANAKKSAYVLYAINNRFKYQKYYTVYESMLSKLETLKRDLKIKVKSNLNEGYFKDELISLLNSNNYKVSNSKADVVISIDSKLRHSIARSWKITKVSTNISVKSNMKILSNTIVNTIGRSSSTKDNAIASASMRFKKEIIKISLNKILFSKK